MLLTLYRLAAAGLAPAIPLLLARRARRGKEDPTRRHERLGRPTCPRPEGRLVWMHGASVGESHVLGLLADALLQAETDRTTVLLTTQTVTSATRFNALTDVKLRHQFVPVDTPRAIAGFLDHWRPDVAVWVESELWPNLLHGAAGRGIPALLANARMSERSFRRWRRLPGTARALLRVFRAVFPADRLAADRLARLGIGDLLRPAGNLKLSAPSLPVEPQAQSDLRAAIGGRPVWLAASTHAEDEAVVLAAHRLVRNAVPDALLILAPRHPDRGEEIAERVNPPPARRSSGALPAPTDAVYLADTMGELGSLFAACPVVFVGGSLGGHGGHNPIEPARFGPAIVHGPDMANFSDIAEALARADAARVAATADGLGAVVAELLQAPATCRALGGRARDVLTRDTGIRDAVVAEIRGIMDGRACG